MLRRNPVLSPQLFCIPSIRYPSSQSEAAIHELSLDPRYSEAFHRIYQQAVTDQLVIGLIAIEPVVENVSGFRLALRVDKELYDSGDRAKVRNETLFNMDGIFAAWLSYICDKVMKQFPIGAIWQGATVEWCGESDHAESPPLIVIKSLPLAKASRTFGSSSL